MPRSLIRNISLALFTLPLPYQGVLAPGQAGTVIDPPATVWAIVGNSHGALDIREMPDAALVTIQKVGGDNLPDGSIPPAKLDSPSLQQLAALPTAANKMIVSAAAPGMTFTWDEIDAGPFGKTMLGTGSAGDARTALELGDAAQASFGLDPGNVLSVANADARYEPLGGGGGGIVRYAVPVTWFRNNFAANLTDSDLATRPPGSVGYLWRAPRAGSVVGVTVNLAGAVTAGFLVARVHAGGNTFSVQCNPGVRPDGGSIITADTDLYPYAADAQISVTLDTSADYADNSGNLLVEVWVYVQEAPAET